MSHLWIGTRVVVSLRTSFLQLTVCLCMKLQGGSLGCTEYIIQPLAPFSFQESVPIVGRLSNANFAQYERTNLPMLIMFLDLPGGCSLACFIRNGISCHFLPYVTPPDPTRDSPASISYHTYVPR